MSLELCPTNFRLPGARARLIRLGETERVNSKRRSDPD